MVPAAPTRLTNSPRRGPGDTAERRDECQFGFGHPFDEPAHSLLKPIPVDGSALYRPGALELELFLQLFEIGRRRLAADCLHSGLDALPGLGDRGIKCGFKPVSYTPLKL